VKIYVYNTLTQKKEEFAPRKEGEVSIYVCGVTPYAEAHLGHARPSVVWDVIKRFFRSQGYKTIHVQNFTDVDDKIIERAQQQGVDALEISSYYTEEYLAAMDALGVERADYYPKVSEHIPEIVGLVETLVEKEHAYQGNGDVFFHVASFPEYGKLSKQKLEELREGTRFEVDPAKRDAVDFALWKGAKPGEPAWDSPWGLGRPGWHIECSAMSQKYLGEEFDFHGGGTDLIFPHHENEIAQSEAATGKSLARYWVHTGMINLKDEKMSKSLGNVISIKQLTERYPKELLRFYLLSVHYRSALEYYEGKLEEMERGWSRLNDAVRTLMADMEQAENAALGELEQKAVEEIKRLGEELFAAFSDDFNTAKAIGVLFELVREVNTYKHNGGNNRAVFAQALELFQLYAIDIMDIVQLKKVDGSGLTADLLDLLLGLREELRRARNFELADRIRDELAELGVTIEDTPQGPRWKV
jgi:cysteinyl-tRNA synthetase